MSSPNFLYGFQVNLEGFRFVISEYNAAKIINANKTSFLEVRYGQANSLYFPYDRVSNSARKDINQRLREYFPELFT